MMKHSNPAFGLAVCFVLLGVQPCFAQSDRAALAGQALASTWCADCHRITQADRDINSVPPDFGAIADMPSLTELSLRVFLQTPHGTMPRYQFTQAELDDIIAYLFSLKQR